MTDNSTEISSSDRKDLNNIGRRSVESFKKEFYVHTAVALATLCVTLTAIAYVHLHLTPSKSQLLLFCGALSLLQFFTYVAYAHITRRLQVLLFRLVSIVNRREAKEERDRQ